MSVVTQIGGADPNYVWVLGALPLGLGLDLALGDLPGRTYSVRWMNRLIEVVEDGVRRTVARLGGGRGGDLFGGLLLVFMVVGTAASLAWLVADVADRAGGLVTLLGRTALIAAGLAVRPTGDRILRAAESSDRQGAQRWLTAASGRPATRLDQLGIDRVCVAAVGELTSSAIVAPLFWLALGGPAAMWGFLAIRSLRETMQARDQRDELAARVAVTLADAAEMIPALLSGMFLAVSTGILRIHFRRAWRTGWRAGRTYPRLITVWGQATLAGALGIQLAGGRVFGEETTRDHPWLGEPIHQPDGLSVVRAVRIMQLAALLAAGCTLLVTIVW